MEALFAETEILLRKAVCNQKAAYELSAEAFKSVSAEIEFGKTPSDLMQTIRRAGSVYISKMGAYEQAIHNLEDFLSPHCGARRAIWKVLLRSVN